jgi:RecB family exonuclease
MNSKIFLALLASFTLAAACARMETHPMDMSAAVESAKTHADHEALAKHYDAAAQDMQAKVEEHKKLLVHYGRESYLYPKQTPSMKDHCQMLINLYQKAAEENRMMAESHRQLSKEAK